MLGILPESVKFARNFPWYENVCTIILENQNSFVFNKGPNNSHTIGFRNSSSEQSKRRLKSVRIDFESLLYNKKPLIYTIASCTVLNTTFDAYFYHNRQ